MSETLPCIAFDSGTHPRFSVLWLHGLGASGDDFVPVAQELRLPQAVRHIFPQAPQRPVSINGGFVMPAWYDIRSSDIGAEQDAEGILASRRALDRLIGDEIARGTVASAIFVAGFSQGGAIALDCGLRRPEALGGILALSTYLPLADRVPHEATKAGLATPIFMAHGRQDPVVPYGLGKQSADWLQQLGCTLSWHEYAMPHSVSMEEMRDIERWLSARMAAAEE